MNLSGGGMQSYMDQAKKMGLVMTDDQLNKIVAVNEQMNILKDAFKGAEVELETDGADEQAARDAILALVQDKFGEGQ